MLFYWDHRVDEGMHIEGYKHSIEVIVRSIKGTRKKREAELEIICSESTSVAIKSGEFIQIAEYLSAGILKDSVPNSNKVRIGYSYPYREYVLTPKKYPAKNPTETD